ncbi:MAG: glycosyltransferase [Elusimicrobiales bacterium]|nr:glycosyltransferase [Elusimicrobiales bacterium]
MVIYSIIIPTLANHKYLLECLSSLNETTDSNCEIIIAYNGKKEKFKNIEKKIKDNIKETQKIISIQLEPYGGIAKTCNDAFKYCRGNYICYVHDDVIILENNWHKKLSDILDKYNIIGMIGGSEPKYIDRTQDEMIKIEISENLVIHECDWSPTISMTKREYMENGCLFDEFYLCGFEDADWALSFRRLGKKIFYCPINHNHIGNQGSYALFKENFDFLSYYSKEGPRKRYFLNKNKDILKKEYYQIQLDKWQKLDRDISKSWWKKLYLKYYINKIVKFLWKKQKT